jgi:hypothetical protein
MFRRGGGGPIQTCENCSLLHCLCNVVVLFPLHCHNITAAMHWPEHQPGASLANQLHVHVASSSTVQHAFRSSGTSTRNACQCDLHFMTAALSMMTSNITSAVA